MSTVTPEHRAWAAMKTRCLNPKCRSFKNYGKRGITVCERWLHSFSQFLADMGPRPSKNHSIDRIDNDGPYSPENCRWATMLTQNNNKRNTPMITFEGITKPLTHWAKKYGLNLDALRDRLFTQNWDVRRALTHKMDRSKSLMITYRNLSADQCSRACADCGGPIRLGSRCKGCRRPHRLKRQRAYELAQRLERETVAPNGGFSTRQVA